VTISVFKEIEGNILEETRSPEVVNAFLLSGSFPNSLKTAMSSPSKEQSGYDNLKQLYTDLKSFFHRQDH